MATTTSSAAPSAEVQDMIDRLNLKPGHAAVVGLQWGDEGKGKVVDLLTAGFDVVARYNGGANAGHTVCVGDKKYALHLIPSGILYPDKLNVLGNGVVIDPEQVVKEITGLRAQELKLDDNFVISDRAHVVMPYHKAQDALQEAAYVMPNALDQTIEGIGTTGRGIGPCYADKALRSTAVRMSDLKDFDELKHKLHRIVPIKNATLAALAQYANEAFTPINVDELLAWLKPLAEQLVPHLTDGAGVLHDRIQKGDRILFEGANATLLDIDHGTYPYVTSSNCSSLGVHTGTGVAGHHVTNVIGIVKAYQTRVGGGPMPTQLDDETGERIRQVGREFGTTTGRPRRTGWLDLVALKYTATVSGATGMAIMLLDVLAGLPKLKVCTAYEIDGQRTTNFPADIGVFSKAKPVYETLPGFPEDVTECTDYDQLPEAARGYLKFVEDFLGVPIVMVSVGPKRSQSIFR
ncbi:adenylosuccinate synthase [Algisphaera agarilytica]|uniref:Adenylosuccinate synthetase n=1 Tax=Algisphaera agarilytica TaxID=1385975 RepID=A0A7X0H485_9BACT|nr:adenylosuccinate synthase [Algisphaera agarilytica]MBB6428767.1 adenylosuccinate synthase [Algisphaera agarilytica]